MAHYLTEKKQAPKPFTPKQIKGHLRKLNARWNDNYWLYVANGELHLMKKKRGERLVKSNGGMSQEAIVDSYLLIEADGGDW